MKPINEFLIGFIGLIVGGVVALAIVHRQPDVKTVFADTGPGTGAYALVNDAGAIWALIKRDDARVGTNRFEADRTTILCYTTEPICTKESTGWAVRFIAGPSPTP